MICDGSLHSLYNCEWEPHTVFERTAPSINASIRMGGEEVLDQKTVCAMKLNAIEAGSDSASRGGSERLNNVQDFLFLKLPRHEG